MHEESYTKFSIRFNVSSLTEQMHSIVLVRTVQVMSVKIHTNDNISSKHRCTQGVHWVHVYPRREQKNLGDLI